MRKKWKRSKNKILVLMLSVVCSVGMFPSFDSDAATDYTSSIIQFNHVFAPVYGGLDETVSGSIEFRKTLTFGGGLVTGHKYLVTGVTGKNIVFDWKYDDSRNNTVTNNQYFYYGGHQYPLVGQYLSVIVDGQGASSSTFDLGTRIDYAINSYNGNDGYVYQNEFQATMTCSGEFKVYMLLDSDLEFYDRFQVINQALGGLRDDNSYILQKLHSIMLDIDSLESVVDQMYDLLIEVYGQEEADKVVMDNFQQNSSSQSSQLGQLNQENKVDKIDINNASTTVDSNIDLNAVGSSGVVLSSLTGHQKILSMLLGVTATSLIAYVFFGKR